MPGGSWTPPKPGFCLLIKDWITAPGKFRAENKNRGGALQNFGPFFGGPRTPPKTGFLGGPGGSPRKSRKMSDRSFSGLLACFILSRRPRRLV